MEIADRSPARLRDMLGASDLAQRLLWIFDHQQEGIIVTDADGCVLDANHVVEHLSGITAEQLIGTGSGDPLWAELRDVEGRPLAPEERPPRKALESGEPVRMLVGFRDRWLRVQARCAREGATVLCVTSFVDVSTEIRAREEAADARRHVERIAEVVDRALYTVEIREDGSTRIAYTSRGFDALMGRPDADADVMGLIRDATHPDDVRRVERHVAALRRGDPLDYLHRVVSADGRTRWVRSRAITWRAPDGRRYVDGVITDVTAEHLDRTRLEASEAAHRTSAREQAAIGRLATRIAAGASPEEVFMAIAAEVGTLLDVPATFVAQFAGEDRAVVRGLWPRDVPGIYELGLTFPLAGTAGEAVRRTGAPAHVIAGPGDPLPQRVGAPIRLGADLWGYIGVIAGPHVAVQDVPERLEGFAELLGVAVASAAARERLVQQATTDALTGLVNHRVFQERLREELDRARRHGRPLALILADLDHFKLFNDALGHQAGDEVLRTVADPLSGHARTSDTVARLGGDEFAMLLPETDVDGACAMAERIRSALAGHETPAGRLTISAGAAASAVETEADELLRMADGALYAAKAAGRDSVRRYQAGATPDLSGREHIDRLTRSQALTALRALSRVIDLKDASTREHGDRVATLAADLATELGWPEDRVALLRDAAALHDVGKVAVSDAVLAKAGPLAPHEYEEVKRHAAIGATIAAEALGPEQVAWIRQHHERPDGRGYPDGLAAEAISDGARLLAMADAWDGMTSPRHYKAAKSPDAALEECRRLAGTQFHPEAVAALERICATGA